MLIILTLILTLIGTIWAFKSTDETWIAGYIIWNLGLYSLILMLVALPICHIITVISEDQFNKKYVELLYKTNGDAYRNEYGMLSEDILNDILEVNKHLVNGKNIQRNFWIGAFVPNVYDEYVTINYERYDRE